jgi:hypothetical protein
LQDESAKKTVNAIIAIFKNLIEDCKINDFPSNIFSNYRIEKKKALRFSELTIKYFKLNNPLIINASTIHELSRIENYKATHYMKTLDVYRLLS